MNQDQARKISKNSTKVRNLYKHMLATEAAMISLAKHFGEDDEKWGMAGLLHDIDYDATKDDFESHGRISAEKLRELGLDDDIVDAVSRHPGHDDNPPQTRMDWALYAVDPLTGLIVSAALIHPDKKLSSIDTQFVLNRFGEKRFAAGANREQIAECEDKLGIKLEKFIEISLEGMQDISDELGL
ncbi:MAG: HDIG domain-containing metalloprotein [Candidatus Zixiibacteriota bacterium]